MAGALLLAEGRDGKLERITAELAALGKQVFGGAHAVATDASLADALFKHGASTVYLPADPAPFADYRTAAYTRLLATVSREAQPEAILLPAVYRSGRDLGPRLAARLDAPIVAECTAIAKDGDTVRASRMLYTDRTVATFTTKAKPAVYTCVAGIAQPLAGDATGTPVPIGAALEPSDLEGTVELLGGGGASNLADAKVVIAVGRGVTPSDYKTLIEELRKAVNGTLGASRAVTDAGHLPHELQIGQTGVTVAPDLYVAIGISGAIQHLAGMRGAKTVIAINKDKDAPIFKAAQYGIVDDYKNAVPKLLDALRKA